MFFEVISILIAWLQLLTLHPNSTNFGGNFETSYSSGSVLLRNLIFSIEFEIYMKILSENALCVPLKLAVFLQVELAFLTICAVDIDSLTSSVADQYEVNL